MTFSRAQKNPDDKTKMRNKTTVALVFGALAAFAMAGSAYAGNKYVDLNAAMAATKGSAAAAVQPRMHLSRFCRDISEKSGKGEVVLPAGEQQSGPKNFRNNS